VGKENMASEIGVGFENVKAETVNEAIQPYTASCDNSFQYLLVGVQAGIVRRGIAPLRETSLLKFW
jgi:hypothetical protein